MEKLMAKAKVKEFGKPHPDLDPPEVYRPPYTLKEPPIQVDPITYEIVMHRLWYLTISFGETLKNVSGSIVAAEANDMSTFITLEDGAPVFIGPYIVFHAGTADMVISNTIKYNKDDLGINDGDMFFCNDPYLGAPHQPDCVIVCPIFVDGELFCWSGSTLHQVDIGGIDPGGMCVNARDCYAEPNLYPAVKIVEKDKFRPDIDRMLRKNCRLPDIIALDFRAMISANIVAKRSMLEIVDKYGKDVVKSVMIMVQNKASEAFKERLKKLPRGKFRGREFNEIGGTAPELQDDIYETNCTVINTGEKLIFDYTGTSKQSTGFANCSLSVMRSATMQAFFEQLAYDIPWNAGILVNIEIITQKGTTHNPIYPAAIAGSPEAAISSYSSAVLPVAQMLSADEEHKGKSLIASCGNTALTNTLAGIDENGKRWGTLLLDMMASGYSGNAGSDGDDLGGNTMIPYLQIANVETNEFHYPLLYLCRRIAKESIGAGYNRGGGALEFALVIHGACPMHVIFWTHGTKLPNAQGISGGLPSGCNRIKLARNTGIKEKFKRGYIPSSIEEFDWIALSPKSEHHLDPGDIIFLGSEGSGGYGDPIKREPERVLKDINLGLVSIDIARKFYGVIVKPNTLELDLKATKKERAKILEERLKEGKFPHEWGRLVPPGLKEENNNALEYPTDFKVNYGDPSGGRILLVVGNARKVVRLSEDVILWVCADCNYVYGSVKENPKLRAKMRVGYLNDLANFEAQTIGLENPEFFYREFYCPQCGLMWEGEVGREIDPILNSIEYDQDWLESLKHSPEINPHP